MIWNSLLKLLQLFRYLAVFWALLLIIIIISFSRFLLLKKIPTRRKLISAAIIVLGLFICLIPTMFPWIDPEASTTHDLGGETGLARILWPVTFMVGLVSKTL